MQRRAEYLTLGVAFATERGGGVVTTPTWDETWEHPAGTFLVATAIWGAADEDPATDAFELFRTTEAEPLPLETIVSDCESEGVPVEDLVGPCTSVGSSARRCNPVRGRSWTSAAELVLGETYALVFYPARGNPDGKPLNADGESQRFAGERGLVMPIAVVERDLP